MKTNKDLVSEEEAKIKFLGAFNLGDRKGPKSNFNS